MPKFTTCTIYCITCSATSMGYIGVSKRYQYRVQEHLNSLRNAKHINNRLQQAFNEHGEISLSFRVLEANVPIDRARAREQFWIEHLNTLNKGYNLDKGGGGIRKGISKQTKPLPEPLDINRIFPQPRTKLELLNERHVIEVSLNLWQPLRGVDPKTFGPVPGRKFCGSCHQWLKFSCFSPNKNTYDKLHSYCKSCRADYARERYWASKNKQP